MASTYTVNLGIEKIGTGEQSGTWGTTTNTNLDLIDQAVNGAVTVTLASAGTSGSPNTLAITNGAVSDGRNKFIEFDDGGDLGATAYVQLDPNDAEKIVHVRNSLSGGQTLILFQGTYNASNDFEVPNGKDVVLKFDGAGASATVTDVFTDLQATAITTPDLTATTADINGGTIDGATIATSDITVGAGKTLDVSAGTFTVANDQISGDAIDGGTATPTTLTSTTVNATTVDTTNIEVTNLKAKDGTSAGSIADSTGVVTIASSVLTTVDINGGTIDGVTIGGSSAGAGSFTTLTASGDVNFDSGTLFVDASADAVGIGTTSPSALLHAASSADTTALKLDNTATSGRAFQLMSHGGGSSLAGKLSIYDEDAGIHRLVIDSSGNVGIGDSSPSYKLVSAVPRGSVSFATYNTNAASYDGWISSTSDNGLAINARGQTAGNATGDTLYLQTGDTTRAVIDSSGRVGIGTTSPFSSAVLTVTDDTDNFQAIFAFGEDATSEYISMGVAGAGEARITAGGIGSTSTALTFHTSGSGTEAEAMRIDSSGNVGIGDGSPGVKLEVTNGSDSDLILMVRGADNTTEYMALGANGSNGVLTAGASGSESTNMVFRTASSGTEAEAMRIDTSGNLLVGTTDSTASGDNGWAFFPDGGAYSRRDGTASAIHFRFYNNADVSTTQVGNITSSGSSTAYNTSSDARLKENIADAEDAGAKVDAIQVRQFDWKADGSHQDYGMVAQELLEVAPEAVSGDPESDDMMGVDYSKLVPMLVKEIQSLRARVHALEGK